MIYLIIGIASTIILFVLYVRIKIRELKRVENEIYQDAVRSQDVPITIGALQEYGLLIINTKNTVNAYNQYGLSMQKLDDSTWEIYLMGSKYCCIVHSMQQVISFAGRHGIALTKKEAEQ